MPAFSKLNSGFGCSSLIFCNLTKDVDRVSFEKFIEYTGQNVRSWWNSNTSQGRMPEERAAYIENYAHVVATVSINTQREAFKYLINLDFQVIAEEKEYKNASAGKTIIMLHTTGTKFMQSLRKFIPEEDANPVVSFDPSLRYNAGMTKGLPINPRLVKEVK